MKKYLFLLSFVLANAPCKAANDPSGVYPRLAILHDGEIVVPTGQNQNNPPKDVRVFVLPTEEGDKVITDSGVVQLNRSAGMSTEKYIFYGCRKADFYGNESVASPSDMLAVVFESKQSVFGKQKGNVANFQDKKSGREWKVVRVAGSEGMNYFLQEFKAGQCVSHQKYYGYLGYDIEEDSNDAFEKASCGVEIDVLCPECVH